MRYSLFIIALLSAALAGAAARADNAPTTQPAATQPAATQPSEANAGAATQPAEVIWPVTVSGIDGIVQVRLAEDKPWMKAQVGMKLESTAETRTGPRSAIRITLPSDKSIVIDRLGTYKIERAIREGGSPGANSGTKYGRTRYDIEQAGIDQSIIRSPDTTHAIRSGSNKAYEQLPLSPEATTRLVTGRAQFRRAPTTQPSRPTTTQPAE